MKVLFGGSRFIFWTLSPLLVVFAIWFPTSISKWTPMVLALVLAIEAVAALLAIGLYDPRRFEWMLRCVSGIVFIAYVVYLAEIFIAREWSFKPKSVGAAAFELILIGWPCLQFTLHGFRGLAGQEEQNPES